MTGDTDTVREETPFLGLISGTSRDGLDVALVALGDGPPELIEARCFPYPHRLRHALDAVIDRGRRPRTEEVGFLDRDLGRFFATCCSELLETTGLPASIVRAIGSHGQTVWHEPSGDDPVSLQLGHAGTLARETGITVVSNFRSADLAAGGEGAPLAPLLHRELFGHLAPCVVLNLGGIANLTLLGPVGQVSGFDTGPANCLLDAWCRRHRDKPFDEGGAWAAGGEVLPDLLERLLGEPWFALPPPKSTGLEQFHLGWLDDRLAGDEAPADVQRTLLELTVTTIADALRSATSAWQTAPGHVLVCGGGVHNAFLMARLGDSLGEVAVESTAAHGVHPDWVEATLFAWLARERLAGRTLDTPPITGARHAVRLGDITTDDNSGAKT